MTAQAAAIITATFIVAIGALRQMGVIDANIQDLAIAVLLGGGAGYSIGLAVGRGNSDEV